MLRTTYSVPGGFDVFDDDDNEIEGDATSLIASNLQENVRLPFPTSQQHLSRPRAVRFAEPAELVSSTSTQYSSTETLVDPSPFTAQETISQIPDIPQVAVEETFPLSDEQNRILQKVLRGYNVFFTGPAGTGKSVLLKAIISKLRPRLGSALAVTASTGIAACNIGGCTLHSFCGFGLGKEPMYVLPHRINDLNKQRWRETRVLIIDEISMIDGYFFDKIEYVARKVREDERPFGGLQLVISGDFFQLPPVPDTHDGVSIPATFAFDARTWNECIPSPMALTEVFRQESRVFVALLNNMRHGRLTADDDARLRSLSRPLHYDDGIEPTELFPLRAEVERANNARLSLLPEPSHEYHSLDVPGVDLRKRPIPLHRVEKMLEKQVIAVKMLTLKVGAQVMLIKNQPGAGNLTLVNGSVGIVEAFVSTERNARTVNESVLERPGSDGNTPAGFVSIPLPVGESAARPGNSSVWPLVRFDNGRTMLCSPEKFSIENAKGLEEASRTQVPLILAWALSIHKSQGQTIERVKANMGKIFEKGQAYVAISRATKMETLQLIGYSRSKVTPHPRVVRWAEECRLREEQQRMSQRAFEDDMENEEAIRAYYANDELL